jgi:hypothetical protein
MHCYTGAPMSVGVSKKQALMFVSYARHIVIGGTAFSTSVVVLLRDLLVPAECEH